MRKIFLTLILFFLGASCLFSNSTSVKDYRFKHLTLNDGLSQSTISAIYQDNKGYIWFGTADGLNRYDGYNFKIYYNDISDTTTISENSVRAIFEDEENNIWLGTLSGVLNKFNRKEGTFEHIDLRKATPRIENEDIDLFNYPIIYSRGKNETITCIKKDNNNLFVGTLGNGLYIYNTVTKSIKHILSEPNKDKTLSSNKVTSLEFDKENYLWIGTLGGGLNRLNYVSDNEIIIERINPLSDRKNTRESESITCLFVDKANYLWYGTFGDGLNSLNLNKDKPSEKKINTNRVFKDSNRFLLSNNNVTTITEDQEGCLWIGTFGGGVSRFNKETNNYTSYVNNPSDPSSIIDNDVISLFVDKTGILWVGTHLGKGVSVLDKNTVKFDLIKKETFSKKGLNDNIVWGVTEDDNYIWIATYKGGLNRYDKKTGEYKYYQNNQADPWSISDNHVRSLLLDDYGNLWVGTYSGGLNCLDIKTDRFYKHVHNGDDSTSISGNQILSMYIDDNSTFWLAVYKGGLNRFEFKKDIHKGKINFRNYTHKPEDSVSISDDRVYCLFECDEGDVWVGTLGGGFNYFNKEEEKFTSFRHSKTDQNSLSNDQVMSILEDSYETVWIGTFGGGLNKFNHKTHEMTRFIKNGFHCNSIYSIQEDSSKNLWMGTDIGLVQFNLDTEKIVYYDHKDGIQDLEFSGGASLKSKDGKMFFGGINGLNYFYPGKINENKNIPSVQITDIKIFNESIKGEKKEIELSYDQNFFSFEYAALDFTNPAENKYAYYLEGYEHEWQYSNSPHRFAFYKNLAPGYYTFRVKGSNNDGLWNNADASVKVTILTPFWRTWWFITLSVIVILGLIGLLVSKRIKAFFDIERLKVKLAADLHDNIGAGLTEISILSNLIAVELGEESKGVISKLTNIGDTSRQLIDSMSDIVWVVNPKRDSLHDLIIRLKDSFSDFLSLMDVSFKTNSLENFDNLKLPMEYRQNLYYIFKEAINNSVKHSKCSKIYLEIETNGSELVMKLVDDGHGIEEVNILYGNGIENMKRRAQSIGGTLSWHSTVGEGTSILFKGKLNAWSLKNILSM
ncbi:MAG: hypothetical protein JEY94_12395 [Melioribacteraceae bacterium]|nr:hypothetical protein [Melioribacteraceae bacterium]